MTTAAHAVRGLKTIEPAHALIYVMVMQSAADANMTDRELEIIGDIVKHLPVFAGFDINALPDVSRDCMHHLNQPDGLRHTLHLIKEALPTRLHETAYAIACDVAASDGGAVPEEVRLLELLRNELDIDKLHAAAIERGARVRYLIA